MCMRTQCDRCGKPSFAGCGLHVEQVLGDVPPAKRCRCHEEAQPQKGGGSLDWLFGGRRDPQRKER